MTKELKNKTAETHNIFKSSEQLQK